MGAVQDPAALRASRSQTWIESFASFCLRFTNFLLRSGQTATEYFDKYRFESEPLLLRRLADRMLELLPASTEVLAGLELGGVPLATAMSLASGLPCVFVRKFAKSYGTCQAIEGRPVAAGNVVIIEDVITTGGAVWDARRTSFCSSKQLSSASYARSSAVEVLQRFRRPQRCQSAPPCVTICRPPCV